MKWIGLLGENGAVFSGHLLRGSNSKNFSPGLCIASRIVFEEYLEHDGFRRRRHRVIQSPAIFTVSLIRCYFRSPSHSYDFMTSFLVMIR